MNTITSNKQYFNDISVMRVMAMLMVVFYHCLCPYSIWDGTDYFIGFHVASWDIVDGMLAQIHLPIFFLISGFLFGVKRNVGGYNNVSKFIQNKAVRVLVPYVIIGVFLCLLQHRDFTQMLDGISHLWFLLVIFECYVLGKLMEAIIWMSSKKQNILMSVAIMFFLFVSHRFYFIQILGISKLMIYFPYYIVGMLICNANFAEHKNFQKYQLPLIITLLVLFALEQYFFSKRLLTVVLGMCVVLCSFSYFRSLDIKSVPGWMKSLDKCSMGIYIVHHILIQEMNGISYFREIATTHYYIYPIIQFLIITIVSWGFVALCRKNKYSKYVLG